MRIVALVVFMVAGLSPQRTLSATIPGASLAAGSVLPASACIRRENNAWLRHPAGGTPTAI